MAWEIVNRHHAAQKLIARNAVAELQPLWGILDMHDLKGTTADWLKAVRPVVEKGFLVSQYVAAEFVNDYRSAIFADAGRLDLELPNPLGTFVTPQIPDRNAQLRIMVSMKVTGPGYVMEHSAPGISEEQLVSVMRDGFSKSSGAATRLILNGGRGMVRLAVNVDPLAQGVAGVADETACSSCQFLTTPILKRDGAKRMNAVAIGHDFCKCSCRIVY